MGEFVILKKKAGTDYDKLHNGRQCSDTITNREPAHYYFQLEGEKDEEKVRYWVEVSEHDFNAYKIGDYYKL